MLHIKNIDLQKEHQESLNYLQNQINSLPNFEEKVDLAKLLWKSKGGSSHKNSFETIKENLKNMCVSVETCNYCEHNEASDIEHIFPKSFFPEMTFLWENYILACKTCNSGFKLDKCFLIDENGELSFSIRGSEPAHNNIAFINPRVEDPSNFLFLKLSDWKFYELENLSNVDKIKAIMTIDILELNTRDILKKSRQTTYSEIFEQLDRLRRIVDTNSIDEIRIILSPAFDDIAIGELNMFKIDAKENVKKYIYEKHHPSVWYSIKKDAGTKDIRWKRIFETIPEVLNW